MKFVLDQPLSRKLAKLFRQRDHDCIHVSDLSMQTTDDEVIWEFAKLDRRIVISKDRDYVMLASRAGDTGKLLWIRCGNASHRTLLAKLEASFETAMSAFEAGQRVVEIF